MEFSIASMEEYFPLKRSGIRLPDDDILSHTALWQSWARSRDDRLKLSVKCVSVIFCRCIDRVVLLQWREALGVLFRVFDDAEYFHQKVDLLFSCEFRRSWIPSRTSRYLS